MNRVQSTSEIQKYAQAKLKCTDRVALEATKNNWPVVELMYPLVAKVIVGNSLKIKRSPKRK